MNTEVEYNTDFINEYIKHLKEYIDDLTGKLIISESYMSYSKTAQGEKDKKFLEKIDELKNEIETIKRQYDDSLIQAKICVSELDQLKENHKNLKEEYKNIEIRLNEALSLGDELKDKLSKKKK